MQALTEEVQDTQNFLGHRERQLNACQARINTMEGAIRQFLQNGERSVLEGALNAPLEEDWRAMISGEASAAQRERAGLEATPMRGRSGPYSPRT